MLLKKVGTGQHALRPDDTDHRAARCSVHRPVRLHVAPILIWKEAARPVQAAQVANSEWEVVVYGQSGQVESE